jgi:alkanesulfonate monooxygenase SsuD/methylene tetrahydromethanopterin reductase-like flavin-dependent oxidoreductase (luciferase family)
MLSRTQPRSPEAPRASLADIQNPMIDAYIEALPSGRAPRILASRTVFVADDRKEAMQLAEKGLIRMRHRVAASGDLSSGNLIGDIITAMDVHMGTPDEVIASLEGDDTLKRATDLTMQVHSIDPPHPYILRSIELFAEKVAPALGWAPGRDAGARRVA